MKRKCRLFTGAINIVCATMYSMISENRLVVGLMLLAGICMILANMNPKNDW